MLRSRLLKTEHVLFAAYKARPPVLTLSPSCKLTAIRQMPHPLKAEFLLRVQTDGEITPSEAVCNASRNLINDLGIISREFQKEYELRKMANAANQQQNGTEQAAPATQQATTDQKAAVNPQL